MRRLPGTAEYGWEQPQQRINIGHVGGQTIGGNPAAADDVLDFALNPKTGAYDAVGQAAPKRQSRIAGLRGKAGKLLGVAGTAANFAMPAMMFAPMFMGGGGGGSAEGAAAGMSLSPNDMMELGYGRELQRQQILSQSLRGF